MDKLALLLFLASLICLILGLIKPTLFKGLFKGKTSRKAVALTFGLVMITSFIVFGVVVKPVSKADPDLEEIDQVMEVFEKSEKARKKQEMQEMKKMQELQALTPEGKIKDIIQKELTGNNNNDKPYLRDIDLVMENNKAFVIINYNASENLTTNLTLVSMRSKMSDLYLKLYKSGLPIGSVSVCAYMPLIDKYGNESDDIVYTTRLANEEASKVNWNADDAMIKNVVLPKVWSTNFLHPALSSD
ncbi:MAG TPA: hypothetical protein VF008_01605 [Niastella sp.]